METQTEIRTVKLMGARFRGQEVLAKWYRGELWAVQYSNMTQARKKVAQLGEGWTMIGFRPYYVAKVC